MANRCEGTLLTLFSAPWKRGFDGNKQTTDTVSTDDKYIVCLTLSLVLLL